MKNILLLALPFFLLTSCVQKTEKQTVIYSLKVSQPDEIKSVGIRGNDKPLSWDYDTALKFQEKDSVYQVKITYNTGYKFTEAKFTVNGEFELQNEPNRRVEFDGSKMTQYNAVFNQVKK